MGFLVFFFKFFSEFETIILAFGAEAIYPILLKKKLILIRPSLSNDTFYTPLIDALESKQTYSIHPQLVPPVS